MVADILPLLSLAFSALLLLGVLSPVGAILFSGRGTVRGRWVWALICILALITGAAIWILRMRYLASTPVSKGADTRFTFVVLLPWLVYGCFRYQTSALPRFGNLILGFFVTALVALGFWSVDMPPDIEPARPRQPSVAYQFVSLVPSPWLQVLLGFALFVVLFSALAAFAAWLNKRLANEAAFARGALKLGMIGLMMVTILMLAGLFGEVGRRGGLGQDAGFLAYWVALLFASFLPFVYVLNRTGILKWK